MQLNQVDMTIEPAPGTPCVNLAQLTELLKSKDEKAWEKSKWIFDGNLRFLDGQPNKSNRIALGSFPRSGNTFLRKYTDLLTGIHTGSDCTLHVNVMLQMAGLPGEMVVDDKCWITKSHSPWVMEMSERFNCNKVLFITRNPLDAFMSWLELVQNGNHSTKCDYDIEKVYPNYWNEWVEDITEIYGKWFDVYLRDMKKREVPILFVRFEDLLMDPEPELRNIMRFILGMKDITGTNAERRIKEVI